jgi:phthalate 4,5-dioxygenase
MLSPEDNQLITRVGPGTPMGALFRQYWLPTLLASELPAADCEPIRVRLLGENLVAFRDSLGQIGMLKANCPHRGASLFFGRNEEVGLRCVYHGWKFDTTGQCVDMPSEPPESTFKDRIRTTAYPCVERSGVVWTYMGPRAVPPPFPALEWALLPESHHAPAKITEGCNWLQMLEGDLDTVHLDILHSPLGPGNTLKQKLPAKDRNPHIDLKSMPAGFTKAARRSVGDDRFYYRIYQYFMPAFVMLPAGGETITYRVTVPMDDTHTMFWNGEYCPTRSLTDDERARHNASRAAGGFLPATSDPLSKFRPAATPENNYLLDYDAQRTRRFSGIPPIKLQDVAMTEGMGPIVDRGNEHLGSTDRAIVQLRSVLLTAAKALRDHGTTPPGVDDPDAYALRSATVTLPRSEPWLDASRPGLQAVDRQAVLSTSRPD